MGGSYFIARLVVAFVVPLTLASLGPAQSHPELGTNIASTRRKNSQVYRAQDVAMQSSMQEYERRERRTLQAQRKGGNVFLEPNK